MSVSSLLGHRRVIGAFVLCLGFAFYAPTRSLTAATSVSAAEIAAAKGHVATAKKKKKLESVRVGGS